VGNRTRLLCLAACAWLGQPLLAQAQREPDPHEREPRWRESDVWRQPEGLPQDSVVAILQTRDGYVWAGTRDGLSRFDGVRFTTFDARQPDQLNENEVWALAEGDDGSLWIGVYGGGLSRRKDGRFTLYTTRDGLADNFVRTLSVGAAGALWIGTDRGVSRFQDGRFQSYTEKDGLLPGNVMAILAATDGSVLVATQNRLHRLVGERFETVVLPSLDPRSLGRIDVLCRDRQGALWVGTTDGLLRVADGRTTRFTTADGLSSDTIRQLHEDSAGRLWIATSAGLDRYTGAGTGAALFAHEAAARDLVSLHSDREGGLFVGHRGGGLGRFHRGVFRAYSSDDGLPDSDATVVLPDRGGASWIGTPTGLNILRDGRITALGAASGLPRSAVTSLALGRTGILWVGSYKGLYRSVLPIACRQSGCAPRFRPVQDDAALKGPIRVLFEDHVGAVWIGTDRSGLMRYEAGRLSRLTVADGLGSDAVRALEGGGDGSLWIGTKGGGLSRLKGGVVTTFTQADGLPNNSVQALFMDADEALWIATRRGMSRYQNGRFTTYSASEGLHSNHVYSFVEDDRGDLWMTSGSGVFRVAKQQLDDFALGRIRSVTSTVYRREHGLPTSMAAVGTNPGASKAADGRVWFAMVGGLAVADPKSVTTNTLAPPVLIEEARADGRLLDLAAPAWVPPGRGELVFRYTALSFEAPKGVRFKYRLEGFDRDWVDAGTARMAQYTNMPPGRYRFRAIAGNSDGVWNEQGAEFAFTLRPHFYETRWFYGALALALILAGAATQRLRVRRLKARERELSLRVEEAVAEVKVLSGLLPICASCKKIRDDEGDWSQLEQYIHEHSEAQFSHGICPDCAEKLYPGVSERIRDRKAPTPR
jgi:ligand-binding sensor domain-containing protein